MPESYNDWLDRCNAANAPLRERTWADADKPWRYAPYHLTEIQRLKLQERKERMLREEAGAG